VGEIMVQKTFVAVKPDGVQRGLVGEIIKRFEKAGLKIIGLKMVWVNKEFAEEHYKEHKNKPFFEGLVNFIQEGPVVAMVIEGVGAISAVRKIVGGTEPAGAAPGTIRGDFAHVSYDYADKKKITIKNIIHASANAEDAEKEIKLWFKDDDVHTYKRVEEKHIY
jgi:nucleoside-diphosphate kinase